MIKCCQRSRGKLEILKVMFKDCFDVVFREFTLGKRNYVFGIYSGIVNKDSINKNFFHSLMEILMFTM